MLRTLAPLVTYVGFAVIPELLDYKTWHERYKLLPCKRRQEIKTMSDSIRIIHECNRSNRHFLEVIERVCMKYDMEIARIWTRNQGTRGSEASTMIYPFILSNISRADRQINFEMRPIKAPLQQDLFVIVSFDFIESLRQFHLYIKYTNMRAHV